MFCQLAIALLVFATVAESQAPVGLLSRVSGPVQILRAQGNEPVAARTADLIAPGDRVRTDAGSEATFLFCPQLQSARVLPNSEVQFEATKLQVLKGKLGDERKLPSCNLPSSLALAGASQLQSGMLRLRGSTLVLRSPSRTSIMSLQPRFRWDPVDHATAYDLKLMDREERILWRTTTPSPEVLYPPEAPPLAWGQKYWWRVTAREGDEVLMEVGSYFQVLTKEDAEQVQLMERNLRRLVQDNLADSGTRLLLAFLYEEKNMLDEAARVYGEVESSIASQPWIQSRLAELMGKLGWDRLESGPPR